MAKDILQSYIATRKALEEERARVEVRLKQITSALGGEIPVPFVTHQPPAKAEPPAPPTQAAKQAQPGGKRKARRGQLKAKILAELKAAGKEGITLKDLTIRLGAETKRLYKWFYTTGKAVPGLKKIGRGRYRLAS